VKSSRFTNSRVAIIAITVASMVVAGLALPTAEAAGPPYSGPETQATGPAFFGPAPNPFPYCENPTYFDPFDENVNPIGRIDVDGTPNASVTTNGVTLAYELTAEGDPGGQYPGFFPFDGDGGDGDQPKGVEMASGDAAIVSLSEPLFYTQWVFTDVDRENEGFFVTPDWAGAEPGQIAVFGGDANFEFTGTSQTTATFNDTDTVGQDSEAIEGRVQVDLLGAANGISLLRDTGSGQSGFAIGGGCEPLGVAKEVTSAPTWNGTSFDVVYTIRVRNNLPSGATIAADIAAALAAAASGTLTGEPAGIELQNVVLEELLTDPAFSTIEAIAVVNTSGNVALNSDFNGDDEINLLAAGETIPAETEEEFVLTVQYTPDPAGPVGPTCVTGYQLLNQARVTGVADGVDVEDLSDEGADPDPGVNNGGNENDDPTVVVFDCPPVDADPTLEIVKTVLAGPAATCPDFAGGVAGEGAALEVELGDFVTYCISVRNPGAVDVNNVVISDPQAPADFDGEIGILAAGTETPLQFDLVVDESTPPRNVASVTGDDPNGGQLPPASDPANIELPEPPDLTPAIALSKTVLAGADADCSTAVEGTDEFVLGVTGDPITWCFVVTNTGDVALTNVLFTDTPAGITDLDLLDGAASPVLAVGASISFAEPGVIVAGGVDNVASVVGQPADDDGTPLPGVGPVSDENEAAINEAALDLAKTVIAGADADCAAAGELATVNIGSQVTYCFTITNTGGVTMRVEQVEDLTLGVTIPVPGDQIDLAPGDVVVVTHVATATADLMNTASASGTPIDPETGEPFPDVPPIVPTDPAEVEVLEADLALVKTNNGQQQSAVGDNLTYDLTITNNGPDAAVGVVVVDTLPDALLFFKLPEVDGWSCTSAGQVLTCEKATPLEPAASVTLSYGVIVLAAASAGDDLTNTASVTSDTPDPDPANNEDTETTTIVPPASPPASPPPNNPLPVVVINNPPPSPASPPNPVVADPVPPLAVTGGAYSRWLILMSAALTGIGGVMFVGGRRRSEDHR